MLIICSQRLKKLKAEIVKKKLGAKEKKKKLEKKMLQSFEDL